MDYKNLNIRTKLSTLWIVVMLNMAYADILSLNIPGAHEELVEFAGSTPISHLMLIGAVVIQIPILMIVLSQILNYKINRSMNIGAAIITSIFVVGGGSLYPHYIFISTIEVICLLLVIWTAWKWKSNP